MAIKSIENLLKNCSDEELFSLVINIPSEIKRRLIGQLKSHSCSSIEFSNEDDAVSMMVNDTYGIHGFDEDKLDVWVDLSEVGFSNTFVKGQMVEDCLYVVTKEGELFSGDELNEDTLWDVYKAIKDTFSEYDNK